MRLFFCLLLLLFFLFFAPPNDFSDGVAHVGAIEGITTDILERFCVTCGLDGFVRFWDLNDVSKMIGEIR